MEQTEVRQRIIELPKEIFEKELKLLKEIDLLEDYKHNLDIIKRRKYFALEDEYKKTRKRTLSSIDKRKSEVELFVQENDAARMMGGKIHEQGRAVAIMKLEIKYLENQFKAYRAVVVGDE